MRIIDGLEIEESSGSPVLQVPFIGAFGALCRNLSIVGFFYLPLTNELLRLGLTRR